jgi:hypothetical protein
VTPPKKHTFDIRPERTSRASWQMVTFGDCKKGETSAKTGCTPQSGEGGKKEGEVKISLDDPEPKPGEHKMDIKLDRNGRRVVGEIAGFSISSTEHGGWTKKVSKKTIQALEETLSDPDIAEAMKMGGIKSITFTPKSGPTKPKHWTAAFDRGTLLLHPKTQNLIEKSKYPERRNGGLKRVIFHEGGHGVWKDLDKNLKDKFTDAMNKHPEVEEKIKKYLNLGSHRDREGFTGDTNFERKINELHAEVQALRKSDQSSFESLPKPVQEIADEIMEKRSKVEPKPDIPPWLEGIGKPGWKRT